MISLVRVDNRLIHGQVVSTWIPYVRADEVVVVDDEAAGSPLMQAAMTLALPPSVRTKILRFDQADWAGMSRSRERVLLLVRDVEQAAAAIDAGAAATHLNLGNVHFADDREPVSPSVFLSHDELAVLQKLAAKGVEVEARAIPTDHPVSIREIEARLGARP